MATKHKFWFFCLSVCFSRSNAFTLRVRHQPMDHEPERDAHKHIDKHQHKENNETLCILPHYGENPESTKKLVVFEEKIVKEIRKFVGNEEAIGVLCNQHLAKYLREYDEDNLAIKKDLKRKFKESTSKEYVVVENPILTLKMLRRLAKTLMKDALKDCKNSTKVADFLSIIFINEGLVVPTATELERAYNAMIALTFIYGLNITADVRDGPLNETSAKLKYEDYVALANINMEYDQEGVMSYHWIHAAFESLVDELSFFGDRGLTDLDLAIRRLMNVTGLTTRQMRDQLRAKWATSWHEANHAHDRLCEGEYTRTANESRNTGSYRCFYKPIHLGRLNVEILSRDPPIIQIYDFLTNEEIHFIKNESPVPLLRPWVAEHRKRFRSENEYADAYTAKLLELVRKKRKDPRVVKLVKKVEDVTKLRVFSETEGAFEMGLYTPLSQFWNVEMIRGTNAAYDPEKKDKTFATFLMFLTDVRMGGYTTFPDLNVFAEPVKGSAIFFYNYNKDIVEDTKVFHESCPVVLGIKEVANLPLDFTSNST